MITLLLFTAFVAYFLGWVVWPLRRAYRSPPDGLRRASSVEVPEAGPGEVGRLAGAFNEMSRSLARQQRSLAEQNNDLERLANVLRAVLDSTVDGILLSDADGNIQLANRPLVTLTRELGMSFEGTVVDRLLSVEHRMADPDGVPGGDGASAHESGRGDLDEFEDAVRSLFQGFTSPVLDDRGGFLGRIWTLREATEQRELDRLKDDFVATVSHELRTPLTSMMGFLEMIREGEAGELNEEQQRFLAIVYRSSERLQRLVGDLLFVARLDANGLQLQFADVDLDEIVARHRRVVRGARPRARDRPAPSSTGAAGRRRPGAARAARRQPHLERDQVHAGGRRVTVRTFVGRRHRRRRGRGTRGSGFRRPSRSGSSSASSARRPRPSRRSPAPGSGS